MRTTFILRYAVCCLLTAIVVSSFAKHPASGENLNAEDIFDHFIGENAIAAVMPPEPCTTGAVSYCYGNNETTEITYCSGDPDVEVAFVTLLDYSFQSCCDKIEFYQGTGTSGTLLGSITGNGTSGYSYIGEYTANGGDGCVTVVITSDGSGSCADGGSTPTTWEVGCQTICYPPTAVLDVSTEEICSTEADNQDNSQTVVFSASNSIHNQGSSFTSYEWDFGDGSSVTTATPVVSHSYSNSGGYITSLVVTDDLGCESTALEEVLLKLSGTPTFDLSNDADPLGVCPGTEVTLNPNVTPYSWSEPEIQPDPDPTPLPDGTGSSYSSAVIFNQFGENDVISDGTNMTIMLNFEHSYVGDLDIDLVSPDGTRLNLLNFFTNGMGNCNVGGAGEYSGGEGPPGAGDEYYFNINAGTDFSSFSGPGSTSAVGVDIPSGTYAPDDSFAGFNGSPINGVWEIFITDNYNLDDGTLFTWSIDLGPIDAAKISLEEFDTTQQSAVWSGENVVGNTAAPTTSGTATYTLTYTDNFGCVHTEETIFTVLPADDASCVEPDVSINSINADNFFCPNNTVWLNIENNGDLVTPSNMPITIYDGDPTQAGTEILSTIYTTEQIAVGASIDVEFDLALTENLNAHVVLNDDGSLNPPISYTDDFPTTAINESNYSNNSATVDLSCPDNDEDGIFDSIDLDDDNDGITDCEERGLANVAVNSLFTLSGDATAISDNEVRLTEAANNQAGQFWGNNKMDFTYSFDFEFSINLGNSNSGADGIAVVFHNDPDGTSASGATGGGIGAQGIEDGLMLEFDTYFNGTPNDISNDHGSILDTDGGTAPLSAIQDLGDIEDGQWHEVKVTWDAENFILAYYLDDILAGSLNADVVDNYFGGREQVYFGYTASTGGAINDQRIRFGETCDFPFIVDTDGDGIVNELDLDSDNDGIYDAVEAGHNENHTNGIVNGNVGEDGIPDAVQASGDEDAGTVDYLTADSDDDDNFDAYEIDSDGDGCYDSREAGFTDSNHDGTLGGEIVNTNDDGLITSGSDGYTDPGTNYTNNQVGYCLPEICDDGIDNDNDGDTDCLDSDCSEFADCNLPPIADDETAEVDEDSSVAINVLDGDSDPEGNLASLPTIDSQPANGTVEINGDGTITYTPNDNFNGSDSFTYEICDTFASPLCDQATVNITVNPINDEPIANDDDATTDEDTAVTVDVLDNDSDIDGNLGDPEITSGPSNGSVEVNDDGTITYTPEDDFNGEDSFTYEVCDDGTPMPAECDDATVTITVEAVNDNPIALDDSAEVDEDNSVDIDVLDNDSDSDGNINSDSVSITAPPSNGSVEINNDGSVTYTPNDDYVGSDSFVYSVCDDGTPLPAECDEATVNITVNPINDEPIANDDDAITDEDTAVTVDVLDNDSDIDGNLGDPEITSGPSNGSVEVNDDGTITYTPEDDFNGEDSFTYEVCDDGTPMPAECDEATVTITVEAVNDTPIALDDQDTTQQDQSVTTAVLNNDSDIDGNLNADQVTVASDPSNGTAEVNPDGTITYTPNEGFSGDDSYTYTVCDDGTPLPEECATATVNITVSDEAPTAFDDTALVSEDDTDGVIIDVLDNDTDPNDNIDPSTVTITSSPDNGTVEVNPDGTITYTPDENFNGEDSFAYNVCDEDAYCDSATVVVTVDPVNDEPTANDDSASTEEDTAVDIDILNNDNDDLDPLGNINPSSVSIAMEPEFGTVEVNENGTVTYTPNDDFYGEDSFTYSVCDDGNPLPALCDEAVVVINVNSNNDAPLALDDAAEVDEDSEEGVVIDVLDNDSDPSDPEGQLDMGSITITSDPGNGTVDINEDGTVTYVPNDDFYGEDSFVYEICDNGDPVLCDEATVTVTVNPQNDSPIAEDDTANTLEDEAVNIDILDNDSDPDGSIDSDSVIIVVDPENGTVVIEDDGSVTYIPNDDFNGEDSFTYSVCDDGIPEPQECDEATVVITVEPVNDVPDVADDFDNTQMNTEVSTDVLNNDSDIDGNIDSSSLTITSDPSNGSVEINPDGTITYTPNPDFEGEDSYVYEVCDDGTPLPAECDEATVFIAVDNNNPIAEDDIVSTDEDVDLIIDILDNDSDPNDNLDPTTVVITEEPENGSVTVNPDGTVTYIPDPDYSGEDSFTYSVCDTDGNCDDATVFITVNPINDGLVAVDDINNTLMDEPVNGQVLTNDFDPDGDAFNLNTDLLDEPDNGTVVINENGTYTYTPNDGFIGTDSFTYEICDEFDPQACDTAVVTIEVTENNFGENDAPLANNDTFVMDVNETIDGDLIANDGDPDGDDITINTTPISDPTNGTVTINEDGTFNYTPDPDFVGEDSFVYEICDNGDPVLCDQATVVIVVLDPDVDPENNTPPFAADDAVIGQEDAPVEGSLLDNDFDPDPDDIITINTDPISAPLYGDLLINPDGTFIYIPYSENWAGTDQFIYEICDNGDPILCDQATVYITVVDENDPLEIVSGNGVDDEDGVIEDDSITTPEDTPLTLCFDIYDVDGEGVNCDFDASFALNGLLSDGPSLIDTCMLYTPDPDFVGNDTLEVIICDNFGVCDTTEVIIIVTPVNDAPDGINDLTDTDDQTPIEIDVLDNDSDVDGDDLTVTDILNGPGDGTATIEDDGSVTYDPDLGFCGVDSFQYIVCDNGTPSLCDTVTVSIVVVPADSDNDGLSDAYEGLTADTDEDGTLDYLDTDSDGDGIPDALESQYDNSDPCNIIAIDSDGDDVPDHLDLDSDDDGIPDEIEAGEDGNDPLDTDDDGDPDYLDDDSDDDGIPDDIEAGDDGNDPLDTDGDGDPNYTDEDSDGDGIPDGINEEDDTYDADCDNDGLVDILDADPCLDEILPPQGFSPNGDGIADTWVIEGLEAYGNVSIKIFNRWGGIVFSDAPYSNNWDGTGNKSGADALPGSTYFYILDLGDGSEPMQGYVYIAK